VKTFVTMHGNKIHVQSENPQGFAL